MQLAITTVILAGGLGKRIGGAKALKPLQDKAMIGWVLDMASRQSSEVLISANDAPENYASFGRPVIADRLSGWIGPLAGLHAALYHAKHDLVACLPCDTPFLPEDLLPRLLTAAGKENADAAVAVADGKRQPVIGLYHKRVLPSLDAFLHAGERKVAEWQNTLRLSEVVFDNAGSFANINSPDDLSQANKVAASIK